MHIGRIEGTTRVLGKSQGYLGLPILDAVDEDGTPYMLSAWYPGPNEIHRLQKGAPIYLRVIGQEHPPVMLIVGDAPEDTQDTVDA